jgi:signal peptidase II
MTAKKKADIYKLIYSTLLLLLILQLAGVFVFKYFSFYFNYQMIFGLIGDNFTAYLVSFLIFVLLVYLYFKNIIGLEIILILAGLLSNVLDRLFYGGVIDYFSIFFTPKFNLADILIVAGAIILVYKIVRSG